MLSINHYLLLIKNSVLLALSISNNSFTLQLAMNQYNLKAFAVRAKKQSPALKKFLKKFDKKFIPNMLPKQLELEQEVWKEVSCLSCANCCKTMTPSYTKDDLSRIANHFNKTVKELKTEFLMKDTDNGDIVNQNTPCQWLNLKTNMCNIYDVRPLDCATFPHHNKKRFDNFNHVYEQNLDKCPATLLMVSKMEKWITTEYKW